MKGCLEKMLTRQNNCVYEHKLRHETKMCVQYEDLLMQMTSMKNLSENIKHTAIRVCTDSEGTCPRARKAQDVNIYFD